MEWEVQGLNLWTDQVLSTEPPGPHSTVILTHLGIQSKGQSSAIDGLVLGTRLTKDLVIVDTEKFSQTKVDA